MPQNGRDKPVRSLTRVPSLPLRTWLPIPVDRWVPTLAVLAFLLVGSYGTTAAQQPAPKKPEPPLSAEQLQVMAVEGVSGLDILAEAEIRGLDFILTAERGKELFEFGIEPFVIQNLTLHCRPLKADLDALVKSFTEQRSERAIETASLILDRAPDCLLARWIRGQARIDKQDWAGALKDFEQLQEDNPHYLPPAVLGVRRVRPVVMVARVHRLSGTPQKAVTVLDLWVNDGHALIESDVYLERALAHTAQKAMPLARADFLSGLIADPVSQPVYLSAAEALTTSPSHRDVVSGRALGLAAVELAGESPARFEAFSAVAAAEAERGDFASALDWQQRAVAAAPAHRRTDLQQRIESYRRGEVPWGAVANVKAPREADLIGEFRESLIEIKGGRFRMGNERGAPDERPVREMDVADFLLGRTEVTRAQWRKVMGEGPTANPELPMEGLSWEQCQAFVERLNSLRKDGSLEFRLPSEAEWEFAARAGTESTYFFGDEIQSLPEYAWIADNSSKAAQPVATRKPSPSGLCDLYGNVEEWCADAYRPYPRMSDEKPAATGVVKVLRGGSWMNSAARCTSTSRAAAPMKERRRGAGFRLAASVRTDANPPPPTPATTASVLPTASAEGKDFLDEALDALWLAYRDSKDAGIRVRYRTQIIQLSTIVGYTRLTQNRPAAALESFRRIMELIPDPRSAEGWQTRCLAAWIQATCSPDVPRVYDPAAALEAATTAMGQTEFKEWLPYAVLAAAHAERGEFDKAVLRAQQALDQAPAELRDDCRARLMDYQQRRTSRGARPPLLLMGRPSP